MKYKSKKVVKDGITFDSQKEYKRFCELSSLEREGKITNLRRQVKFVLIPAQYEPDIVGKRGGRKKGKLIERECSYIADFVYEKRIYRPDAFEEVYSTRLKTVVEDVKGVRTKDYIIKRKLMLHIHGIRIKEV